ncbi:MAG: hypothetical protein LKH33_08315 [Acetobacter sp.]|jgi:hypothetical protein|nr:hypothetical protein [Acetobacter sp.]MCI1485797.1 hypothetical protein [Acetobacter sp.]MCI1529823.1 hypothetical protein [Acetobacter sp.]MCI1587510.1 hypothetical protein [Acetobacter sp.]MCI1601726.1 hypothetical protein [Acetobacter sp.]
MSLLLPHLRHVRIESEGLKATQWSSPQDKAKLANAILDFFAKGLPEEGFSKVLYQRVSQMWGVIAYFNRDAFAARYSSSTQKRLAFLEQIVARGGVGHPAWTWSDVESRVAAIVIDHQVIDLYRAEQRQETIRDEKAMLRKLIDHHGVLLNYAEHTALSPPVQMGLF